MWSAAKRRNRARPRRRSFLDLKLDGPVVHLDRGFEAYTRAIYRRPSTRRRQRAGGMR